MFHLYAILVCVYFENRKYHVTFLFNYIVKSIYIIFNHCLSLSYIFVGYWSELNLFCTHIPMWMFWTHDVVVSSLYWVTFRMKICIFNRLCLIVALNLIVCHTCILILLSVYFWIFSHIKKKIKKSHKVSLKHDLWFFIDRNLNRFINFYPSIKLRNTQAWLLSLAIQELLLQKWKM